MKAAAKIAAITLEAGEGIKIPKRAETTKCSAHFFWLVRCYKIEYIKLARSF